MRAFHFPLDSLRTLRQQREQAAQQQYSRALVLCDGAARGLQLAEAGLQTGRRMLTGELAVGATAARILNLRTWCTVLEIRRNECAATVAETRRHAGEAFRLMTIAVREREALDRFHDKSLRLWRRACQAEEQKMFDELAVQRQPASILEKPLLN